MATIETKYVDVGYFDGQSKFPDQYGFSDGISIGTLSNTANGTSDPDVSGIYSSVDCIQVVWFDTNTIQFAVEGVRANSGWDSMAVGSTTVNRSDASFSTSSSGNGSTTWTWSSQSNPFGTTVGADVLVEWDDGAASLTAPTIGSVTTNNPASPNVTATVNLSSNGSGGTLEYAQTTTNSIPSTGWQTSNQFTHPRPTAAAGTAVTRYYWASRNRNTSASSSSVSKAVGYFTGDPSATVSSISPSSPLAHDYTGSVDVVITGGSAGTRYRVLNTTTNAGMGNTGDGNGTVTITNTGTQLPTAGNTSNYKLQYKVLESNGGNDIFSDVSPSATFSISRNSPGVVATPTGFTVTDATTSGQTHPNGTGTTNNLSANSLSGHTLQFRVDSGSWSTTSSYSHTYGTQRVYEARYVRTSDSAVSATTASITRRVSDSIITISPVTSITAENTTNELKIADIGGATDRTQYRARATGNINGSTVSNLFINAPVATGANPDINAANPGELPAAGTSATYKIMARIRTSDNGDGFYRQLPPSVSNSSWTLTRAASIGAPTASSVTFNNPSSPNVTATVNLSASGSGGTLQYACEVGDTTPDNWQSSNTFTIARGSSGTVYARARRSTTAVSNTVSAARPGFLIGDTSVSPADVLISSSATNATVSVSDVTSGETYAVRAVNGSTNFATATATSTGVSIGPFTNSLPSEGAQTTYEIFVRRPTSTGGDGATFVDTNDQFTVTRQSAGSGGGGGGSLPSSTYGIAVYNSSGQEIWGVNNRTTNVVVAGSTSVPGPSSNPYAPGSVTITGVEDMTSSNTDVMEVILIGGNAQSYTVFRGTNQFSISNFFGSAGTVGYIVVRYG